MSEKGYKSIPLGFTRRMVIASVQCNKKNAIHCLTKFDISKPRAFIRNYFHHSGEKISFTAYIARCFAETIREFPEMNSFIKGNKLIVLDQINISVMVEREIEGVKVPEPLGLHHTGEKSIKQLHAEIRMAQSKSGKQLGALSGASWIRFIPVFLMRTFIKIADKNISMAKRYGKLAITSVGMFSSQPAWFIPHGTATILLTVGSISKEYSATGNSEKEMLHLTASFDHEIIDGSPAARFISRFGEILQSGELLCKEGIM